MTAAHEDHAFPVTEYDGDGKPVAIETGMTLRQYAAIKLRVPNSGTDWLDEMIREARRDELAERAMQSIVKKNPGMWRGSVAKEAYAMAEAVLAEREAGHG